MRECLPYLTSVCSEAFRRGELKIFAFSTVVSEVKGRDLSRVAIKNTGGTEINCVLKHVTELPLRKRPKVILLATDGYVGHGGVRLRRDLGKIQTIAALTDPPYSEDLKPWVTEIIRLPKP